MKAIKSEKFIYRGSIFATVDRQTERFGSILSGFYAHCAEASI